MRNLYFVLGIALTLTSCKAPESDGKTEKASGKRIEITPFIQTSVVLRDTAMVKNVFAQNDSGNISMYEYNQFYETGSTYLSQEQFKVFKHEVAKMMYEPGSFTYMRIHKEAPATASELKERIVMCDSILEVNFDAQGKETINRFWACDSITVLSNINKIVFFESWYFNTGSKMIEKEILGYGVYEYLEERKGYKDLFFVFRDKKTAELVDKKTNPY